MKKVSIAITVYNQAHYIGQAVESALAQDYPNLEVVVSDNHSTDPIEEVMGRYTSDPRLKYFRNETNMGMIGNFIGRPFMSIPPAIMPSIWMGMIISSIPATFAGPWI